MKGGDLVIPCTLVFLAYHFNFIRTQIISAVIKILFGLMIHTSSRKNDQSVQYCYVTILRLLV